MANRFTDSRKYRDPWFRKLKSKYKLIWDFMIHECDHAGIWKVDFELASFSIGEEYSYNEVVEVLKGKIFVTPKGDWFIPKFVEFQYGTLNPENRVHLSVINILKNKGAYKTLKQPLQGCKDYDKDYDKDKDIKAFEILWNIYPKKIGKKNAFRHFVAAVKTGNRFEKYETIKKSIENYKRYIIKNNTETKYIKNADTFFNNWEEWLNYKEEAIIPKADGRSPKGIPANVQNLIDKAGKWMN